MNTLHCATAVSFIKSGAQLNFFSLCFADAKTKCGKECSNSSEAASETATRNSNWIRPTRVCQSRCKGASGERGAKSIQTVLDGTNLAPLVLVSCFRNTSMIIHYTK